MKKSLKISLFVIGIIILFVIMNYQFSLVYSWKSWNLPLSGKIIVIDAGHGGPDGGAVGKDGTLEKDIALNVSMYLRDYLQEAGALVKMTREEDSDLAAEGTSGLRNRKNEDLKERLNIINGSNADLYLTVHLNAIPSPKWRGAQTFYYTASENSEYLSTLIQEQLIETLQNTTRAAKPVNNIYLLKYAEIPGSLVEIGFLSNPEERELLKTEKYQQQIAFSIYQGLLRYYSEDNKES